MSSYVAEFNDADVFVYDLPPPPESPVINDESMALGENAALKVVNCVHPTFDSLDVRSDVIDHIRRLIQRRFNGCEVFAYGSVPLRTFLPDGDIDLTVLTGPNAAESLPRDVLAIFENEEKNRFAKYKVRDIFFVDAEVKLVKCIVHGIMIDISFNQLGGLSTLCFLDKVDRFIGKNHLFKRSIILVKTWCYYESRILGAFHGLISTYAMETLVLYIFQLHHSSLNGPLAVLYRFLDYYSRFDWDKYCISLKGPVCKESLPNLEVEMPEGETFELMLSEEYLDDCVEMFSITSTAIEANTRVFQSKFLNIVDPLKHNNNLGRSVHRSNFLRIRCAFRYGAKMLGQALTQPRENIADAMNHFFCCTLARHGHRFGHSFLDLVLECDEEDPFCASLSPPEDFFSDDDKFLESSDDDDDIENNCIDAKEQPNFKKELLKGLKQKAPSPYISPRSISSEISSSTKDVNSKSDQIDSAGASERKLNLNYLLQNKAQCVKSSNKHGNRVESSKVICTSGSTLIRKGIRFNTLSLNSREANRSYIGEDSEAVYHLADLEGDVNGHLRNWLFCHTSYGVASNYAPYVPIPSPAVSSSMIQSLNSWDYGHQALPTMQNQFSQMNPQMMTMEQAMYSASVMNLPQTVTEQVMYSAAVLNQPQALTMEQAVYSSADYNHLGTTAYDLRPKARGLGTYFPTIVQKNDYVDPRSSSHGRGYNKAPAHNDNQRHTRYGNGNNGGLYHSYCDSNSYHRTGLKFRGKIQTHGQWGSSQNSFVRGKHQMISHDFVSGQCRVQFGSVGNLGQEILQNSASSTSVPSSSAMTGQERVSGRSFQLRSEDEFPPLSQ